MSFYCALMNTEWDKLAYPRLCGLLAENPSRLGQAMHNAGFKSLELPFVYIAFPTKNPEIAFKSMREMGLRGFSITIPYKETCLSLVDELDSKAEKIAAINTAINYGSKIVGYNTDYLGIISALKEENISDLQGKTVLNVGAGGAANAGIFAFQQLGAERIIVSNRNPERAKKLAKHFGVESCPFAGISSLKDTKIDIIVNSTPIGSHLQPQSIHLENMLSPLLTKDILVFDMATRETNLIQIAKKKGCKTILGTRMLIHQAVEQFNLFTEQQIESLVLEQALQAELNKKS